MSGSLKELSPVLHGKMLSWSLRLCALQNTENNNIQILMVWEFCSINALRIKIFSVYTGELHCIKVSILNLWRLQNFVFFVYLHGFFTFNLLVPSIPMQSPSCWSKCFFPLSLCLQRQKKKGQNLTVKPALILVVILSMYSKSTEIWKLTAF